jgi:hypothetical protein
MAEKTVPELIITSTATGGIFEITLPDGFGGWISRRISYSVLSALISSANSANKGYFVNEAAIIAAYPVGEAGWYCINGDTDTVWIWDTGTSAWVDTTNSGVVVSVNGLTGTVVLEAADIGFTSATGLSATNTRDGIDEVKNYVDSIISGAGGMYVNDSRAGSETVSGGETVINYSDSFSDTNYSLILYGFQGNVGIKEGSETTSGFTVEAIGNATFNYIAISNSSTLSELITEGTPSGPTDTGTKGTLKYDTNYLYICIATDTWRRIAHSTW